MSEEGKNDHRTQKRWASQLTVATVVALLTLALAWSCIPMADWLDGATLWDWIGALKGGSRTPFVLMAAYGVGSLILFPITLLILATAFA